MAKQVKPVETMTPDELRFHVLTLGEEESLKLARKLKDELDILDAKAKIARERMEEFFPKGTEIPHSFKWTETRKILHLSGEIPEAFRVVNVTFNPEKVKAYRTLNDKLPKGFDEEISFQLRKA